MELSVLDYIVFFVFVAGVAGDKMLFPYLIVHGLPAGLTGLVVAPLFAERR